MKKTLAILLALCLAAALLAGCANTPATNDPTAEPATEAPQATEAPVVTQAPTAAPTATPEPTPEPIPDPFAIAVADWDDMDVKNFSFDTIKYNGKVMTDGNVTGYRAEIEDVVDGTDGSIKTVTMRGWAGFLEEDMVKIGYQIDNGPLVWLAKGFETTEAGVIGAGGDHARRFAIDIPVGNLSGKEHELKIVSLTESNTAVYMNPESNPFMLYYDGPEAVELAVDGTVNPLEYDSYYIMDKNNTVSWTNAKMGNAVVEYYLSQKADGVYVGIKATNISDADLIQLDFNPGGLLDTATGLFISFKAGDTLTVLQHNHKTGLKDDDSAGGADISDLVQSAITKTDKGYDYEVKLPAELFTITDVAAAGEFVYGTYKLYFGMFGVIGGQGFTNQSAAPGSDWSAKGLGLNEYFLA